MEAAKELLMKRIIGEIILSNEPGEIMRRWREIFGITQLEISEKMGISPSVISDYEGGRRRSPGALFIKKFVVGLVAIDSLHGGRVIRQFSSIMRTTSDAIIDLYEFPSPFSLSEVSQAVDGEFLTCTSCSDKKILGYTVVDSIRAILSMSGADFYQLMGSTAERALIFTKTSTGRSPMVAVRVTPLKPAAIILHGVTRLDRIAVELAKAENIPMVLSKKETVEELVKSLHALRG
ncbi:MAG: helix-turn-helix domain-containing protein [Candidatus Verstraetearchaeota archaeon]|nr:helix-turn-helix domain-containing protein [Candidatus Verstraetearchaeota archaeon]